MSRPPRVKSFAYLGCHRYFLTFCTYRRHPWFTDSMHVDLARDQFLHSSRQQHVAVNAYCFMPDHVHLLVTGTTDAADLQRFAELSKQHSGWKFQRSMHQRLWQPGYYDRVLRDEDDTAAVISYIVSNPLRARLVQSPVDYPFWGSMTHTREEVLAFIQNVRPWSGRRPRRP